MVMVFIMLILNIVVIAKLYKQFPETFENIENFGKCRSDKVLFNKAGMSSPICCVPGTTNYNEIKNICSVWIFPAGKGEKPTN